MHTWEFVETERANLVFTGSIRLDPAKHWVELKADANGDYPTTGDHYVIGPLFQPKAVRQWAGFEAEIEHIQNGAIGPLTGDGFRLHDGANQYWWNGAAWVVNTTNWNTQAEVAANIATFAATARKLRVVARLTTTDKAVTPRLRWARVAWKGKVFWLEDIIYRSLVPALRNINPIVDIAFKVPFPGGTTLDVGAALDQIGIAFNVVDLDGVFNHSTDPDAYTNVLSSYNASTRVATLSSAIPVGNVAKVRLIVRPEVVVESTSQDYSEVEKVPALVITDIEDVASSPLSQDDGVVNRATGAAIRVRAPYRFDVRFTMIALAAGGVDLARMIAEIVKYLDVNPLLRSVATDRSHRIWLVDEFTTRTRPELNGMHASQATFQIKDVLAFTRPAVNETAVRTLKFGGDFNLDIT